MSPLKNNRLGFSVVAVCIKRVAALEFCSQILSFGSSVVGSGAEGSCRLSPTVAKLNTTGSAALATLEPKAPRAANERAILADTPLTRARQGANILMMLPGVGLLC